MIENYDEMIAFTLFGIGINWTIASTWIVMGLLLVISWLSTRGLKSDIKVSRWQTALEVIVGGIRGQVKEMANDDPMKYLPLAGTFFLFIAMSNLLSAFPWFRMPTASLSTTSAFAFLVLAGIPYFGIRNVGLKKFLKKYTEPTIVLLPINVLSEITSTMAMAVRLFGNMLSAVVIGAILLVLVPFIVPLPLVILGLFTGFIQAYIFAMLTVVYLSSASAVANEEAAKDVRKQEDALMEEMGESLSGSGKKA